MGHPWEHLSRHTLAVPHQPLGPLLSPNGLWTTINHLVPSTMGTTLTSISGHHLEASLAFSSLRAVLWEEFRWGGFVP